MNPYASRGTCDAKGKCKRRRKSVHTTVEIKQEVVVKEEPKENVDMVNIARSQFSPSLSAEATEAINSECTTDSEMDFEYDTDRVKEEVKIEDECSKKECDSAQGTSSNDDDNQGDRPADGNVSNPSSNSMIEKKKRMVERKKPTNQTKETNAKASKKAAVKRQKKHMCHLCNFTASRKSHLTIHIRVHTGERPFVCEVCAKSFKAKSNLDRHGKTHGLRLAFRCSKCREGFAQEIDKTNHESKCQWRHYECYACKYITYDLTIMKRHMQTHSGSKPFECSVCSKAFPQNNILRQHLRTHVKQLPFACPKCGQRFDEESEKQSHENRCNGRRYDCYLCQLNYFQQCNLKRHIRSKHTGEKSFKCAVCGKKFCEKSDLKRHLATHAKPRPIRCAKCWKLFKEEDKKNAHEGQCNRRLYQCYLCKVNANKSAQLKDHMRAQHTGERPFLCGFCEARFVQKIHAAVHAKRHHGLKH
ncbi:zinc finger protein 501-like isoform X2 [Sitodiplosis mosellana]|uniref:zinc finger protein 501-like isoform X2 n=1 Tax=Sitodiplosis mosellana TaxID=263140 RepID=UPI002444EA1A|nr:zinc finger protein 501-like isoform X2 [Sitodiplosis mosellana]